jgi:DNA helicase HerA-like ATPase
MDEYGTVISTLEGPSTRSFSFVVNRNAVVHSGQFIQLEARDGKLIGRISDIRKANRYFMRPESVKEYEQSGSRMDDVFPVDDWEYLVADVRTLGVHSGKGFQECSFPPSPGTRVFEPDPGVLSEFFGLDENGLHIGEISYHDVPARLNLTRLVQKHMAILAISGAGKSFLSAVMIEELLRRRPEQGQLAVVVVDTHGEYASFAEDPGFSGMTSVFPVGDVQIGMSNLNAAAIRSFFPEITFPQERELSKVMASMGRKPYSISDLIDAIDASDSIKTATKDVLIAMLSDMGRTGLFGTVDTPPLEDLAFQGRLSVIDLSDTTNLKKKQLLVAYVARKLFNARKEGIIPPFLLVLEEAHQFVPETAKKEIAISRGIIQTIAREGRKFSASLCLISQRPIQLSTTVLSQCNTQIILRITNPYDLDHIGKSSEGLTRSVLGRISGLRVGSGIIVGEAVNFPLFVKIRARDSKQSSKGLPLEKEAVEYWKRISQKRKDAKAFM